jgi:DNA-binding transcriptional regulator of glucitol operon
MSAVPSRPRAQRSYRSCQPANEPSRKTSEYLLGVSTTRRRRPALIALVILAAGGCLALGWWQWTRFQSVSGTFQNLGYAMQWPLFAGFCVYAYRKFVRYEEAPPEPAEDREITEVPDGLLPERPKPVGRQPDDPALREYNAYLAELAKRDAEKQNRTTA